VTFVIIPTSLPAAVSFACGLAFSRVDTIWYFEVLILRLLLYFVSTEHE
jgi:hypothetical protein